MGRTTKADLEAQAGDAFVRAIESLGHGIVHTSHLDPCDLMVTVDEIDVQVQIKAAAVFSPEVVAGMLRSDDEHGIAVVRVAVGDLITAAARQALGHAGWGWYDRRGHLMLRAKGVHIDADVAPDGRSAAPPKTPISGRAAMSWAAALLLSPEDPPAMREVARRVSMSHSAIVAASKRLVAASLVRSDGRPLIPELFWALAEEWHPSAIALSHQPPVGDAETYGALGVNLGGDDPGWAVAGTVGAVAWGAPMAIGAAYPPDFYVPTAMHLRQAALRLGQADRFDDRACTVAVAPTPLVCTERHDRDTNEWGHWRFANGLYAALDLAQDRARGAEVLADWNPKDFARVW